VAKTFGGWWLYVKWTFNKPNNLGRSYLPLDSRSHDPHKTPQKPQSQRSRDTLVAMVTTVVMVTGVTTYRDLDLRSKVTAGVTPSRMVEISEALASFWCITSCTINGKLFLTLTFDLEGVTRLSPSQNLIPHFAWSTDWRKQNVKKSNGSKVIVQADDGRQTTDNAIL